MNDVSNRIRLHHLADMPPEEAARVIGAEEFAILAGESAAEMGRAKRHADALNAALAARYGQRAAAAALAEGKGTGSVTLADDGHAIKADLPKRVEWDQAALSDAVTKLREMGEDPLEYVSLEVKVDERKFAAWPKSLRAMFEPARTVKAGKPSFKIEKKEQAK